MNYIGFSSTAFGRITLENTKNVTGVSAEVLEPVLGLTLAEYELTPAEIEAGEFAIPETDIGEVYFTHSAEYNAAGTFPEELRLHVLIRYDSEAGEKTIEYTVDPSPEQGWGIQYWADDEEKMDWNYPGHFLFSTYESMIPVFLVMDEPEKAETTQEKTVLSVSLSIDGRKILPEECEIREELEDDPLAEYYGPGEEVPKYYYARLLLKRPEWAPKHGTIHLSVTQQLSGDGSIWTTEKDMEY